MAKGARSGKSKYRALLQVFQPLLISYSGRGEVKTITAVDTGTSALKLQGERLFSAMYLNELLTRVLHSHVEHTSLYQHYQESLLALQAGKQLEPVLRRFELALLMELGYGVNLETDYHSHEAIMAGKHYRFTPDVGFELQDKVESTAGIETTAALDNSRIFSGEHLIALRESQLSDADSAQSAKRLLRLALSSHLGERPLHSRSLFASR